MAAAPKLRRYTREQFVRRVWNHKPGEHVTIVGRTGSGKTTLGYELFARSVSQRHPGVVMLSKPKDRTTDKARTSHGWRQIRTWPPPRSFFESKPPRAHVLAPRFTYKDADDKLAHTAVYQQMLQDTYQRGGRSVYAPDLYGLILRHRDLESDFETAWLNWRSNDADLWVDTQKATHIPLLGFNQPTHLLLFREADKRGRERFDEIGGFDSKIVAQANMGLALHEVLYINQADLTMCVVEA